MATGSWWDEHCPARLGADLRHVHAADCTDGHSIIQCCECGKFMPSGRASDSTPAERRADQPHPYVFTITGHCLECRKAEAAIDGHIQSGSSEAFACSVEHNSITPGRLTDDDEKERWKACPICNVQVEPLLANGVPHGPNYGRGRMPFTQRHMNELAKIKAAFVGGYFQS